MKGNSRWRCAAPAAISMRGARIERTDRPIDQVVYRLYGVTGEGIAVVQGR